MGCSVPLICLSWVGAAACIYIGIQMRRAPNFSRFPNGQLVLLVWCVAGLLLSAGMFGLVAARESIISAARSGGTSMFCRFQGGYGLSAVACTVARVLGGPLVPQEGYHINQ